jgi:23S rRNA pseudouridine1911/1915/1917 synthase
MPILAETDELLVLNKPAGIIVHSDGRTTEPSVAQWLIEHYPYLADVGEPWISPQGERVAVAGTVHRLDRTTSGVLLAAKTPEMFAHLKQLFRERRIEKIYRAIVYGHMEGKQGRIIAEIMRSSVPPKRWYARPCEENDRRAAITEWKLLRKLTDPSGEPASYLQLHPLTGRTHQLRVHLAPIGHPIVADHLYAPERPSLFGFERPALHAYSLTVPFDDMTQTFTAPLPSDFSAVQ